MQDTTTKSALKETQLQFKLFIRLDDTEDIENIYTKLVERTEELSSSYIWNNEPFQLSKPTSCQSTERLFRSTGTCDYGDNVEDEWYIVYILNALTLEYPGRLAAQVNDSDGEFLLIHAANFLPEWAQSAGDGCMENRVFLFTGQLHMIPPASKPSEITYLPAAGPIRSDLHALKCLFDFPKLTRGPPAVQDCIFRKLATFSTDLAKACLHRTTCILPAKLAWLLNHNPSLISAAVNRFCDKDPDDLRTCRFLRHFRPTDLVSYRVQFTKHLYGKLKYTEFKADKRHEWPTVEALMAQNLGTTIKFESYADSAPARTDSKNLVRERSLLGLKLTCAFEILVTSILSGKSSRSFEDYVARLTKLGYFKNFMENSQKYNELMEKARESFLIHEQANDPCKPSPDAKSADTKPLLQTDTTGQSEPAGTQPAKPASNYAKLFESIYLDNQPDSECFSKLKSEISKDQDLGSDDSDDWLCVEAPQLDDYLEMYSRGEVSSTYDFSIISNAFKRFLEIPKAGEDLLEGAEFKPIGKDTDNSQADEVLIDFNPDSIRNNLVDLLGKTRTEEDNEDESDSFYEVDEELLETADAESRNLKSYMISMDDELRENKGLSRLETLNEGEGLDLDLNLVSNALESYSSQLGCTGPVSNILKSLGL